MLVDQDPLEYKKKSGSLPEYDTVSRIIKVKQETIGRAKGKTTSHILCLF